jgi:hypothetical protein
LASKYLDSSADEEKCLDWIEEVTGEQVDDLYLHLKSGRTLCRMMNKFIPKTILKINYGHQEFHEMVLVVVVVVVVVLAFIVIVLAFIVIVYLFIW